MADGASYEGPFAADKCHGLGAYTYVNGDTYSGAWCSGAKGLWLLRGCEIILPPPALHCTKAYCNFVNNYI